jgi:hypothetical protein
MLKRGAIGIYQDLYPTACAGERFLLQISADYLETLFFCISVRINTLQLPTIRQKVVMVACRFQSTQHAMRIHLKTSLVQGIVLIACTMDVSIATTGSLCTGCLPFVKNARLHLKLHSIMFLNFATDAVGWLESNAKSLCMQTRNQTMCLSIFCAKTVSWTLHRQPLFSIEL